jgi:hypothetical protein
MGLLAKPCLSMEGYKPPHEQPEEERQQKHIEAVEHEEERLELLEKIQGLRREFGHWAIGEGEEKQARMRAAEAALDMVSEVLRGDDEGLQRHLGNVAERLGYRVEQGSAQNSPSQERQQMTEQDAENLRGWGKTGEELERWKRE